MHDVVVERSPRLVLFRTVLWETSDFAHQLADHLSGAGRPFIRQPKGSISVPGAAKELIAFELFMLPLAVHSVARLWNKHAQSVGLAIELKALPILHLYRKSPPADPTWPCRDFDPFLACLPRWKPGCLLPGGHCRRHGSSTDRRRKRALN